MNIRAFRSRWMDDAQRIAWACLALCALTTIWGCAELRSGLTFGKNKTHVADDPLAFVREHYEKREYRIPMRDGVHLFTAVYSPKDTSRSYPFLLLRTPYGLQPYGEDQFPRVFAAITDFIEDGYIFVAQDVRGRFMSEGEFVNMRPHIDVKASPADVDESSDTYDTIEWLLTNVPNHNGRAGMWGLSYPGFYAAAGMIDSHPALKAVSPQAPIADWYFDDFHHHGAFFLPHAFNFIAVFGQPRPAPTTEWPERFDHGTPDGYRFFLDLGPLANVNELYFHGENPMWDNMVAHPDYDAFWQARNLLPHLHNVSAAVMTVGGWFDAEDLYGPLKIYRSVEKKNPGIFNMLVMGPWPHGGWWSGGEKLGHSQFGSPTADFYRKNMLRPFFLHFLHGAEATNFPEAYLFETGANQWRRFDRWPPEQVGATSLYIHCGGALSQTAPESSETIYDEYVSDPEKPVPFTQTISTGMPTTYMTEDQRFASRRPDVLVYQSEVLEEDLTLAGPMQADLWVSTSGTDSDWVVKIIDVLPPDAPDHEDLLEGVHMGGYQMMVRSEVIRGRYRNSYEQPEPFVPDEPTNVSFELQDVLHTFQAGHRVMVQIQSTWFPLVDRNPHRYAENVFLGDESDFVAATQRVYCSPPHATRLRVGVLPAGPGQVTSPTE